MNQTELNAQNLIPGKIFDYFHALSEGFNSEEYKANIPAIPHLHKGLRNPIKTPLSNCVMTCKKVKEEYSRMR